MAAVKDLLRAVRIDFDNLENDVDRARTEKEVVVLAGDGRVTARYKIEEWFKRQAPVNLYLGHDNEVYPQWRIEKVVYE